MIHANRSIVLERQLLLQLGDRLAHLRKARGLSSVAMARRVGISRTTLAAVEAGDPGPSIGTYLRVMSELGISGDLALLAGDVLQAAPPGTAAARSRRARAPVLVTVASDEPGMLAQAQETLDRWLAARPSRSTGLWLEWRDILRDGAWRKVLSRTRRAQALRQASPLTAVLPDAVRQGVLDQVRALREGVVLGDALPTDAP